VTSLFRVVARFPTLVLARRNVSRATARSVLAVAAVVIGVVAIGAVGAGGEAFKQDQLAAYEGFGGTATVSPVFHPDESDTDDRTFSESEIVRMRRAAGSGTVLPVVESFGSTVRTSDGEALPTVQVKSLESPGRFYDASTGTIPQDWRRTAVVGSRVADDNDIAVGDRISVRVDGEFEREFRVVAVLEPQGFAGPLQADRSVFVPLAQFDDPTYDEAIVRVDPRTGSVEEAERRIESEFNARERTVYVSPVQEQREQFERSLATINRFLVGVGGISLLVAAVTIANTMLMSAIEREGEIGVLRAVGYPKAAVVRLLVAEATILGCIGAAVGAPLAFGVGMVVNEALLGDPLAFTVAGLRYVALGMAFGVGTSLLAGLYPAWKAANKRPVEALD
jgi:putative ABC transport system permease protein